MYSIKRLITFKKYIMQLIIPPITEERPLKHFSALTQDESFNNLYKVFLNILVKSKEATQTG